VVDVWWAATVVSPGGEWAAMSGVAVAPVFAKNGKFIRAWGQLGSAPGESRQPRSIALGGYFCSSPGLVVTRCGMSRLFSLQEYSISSGKPGVSLRGV
jgi:hypothetical protein